MLASELIEKLLAAVKVHGDLPIATFDWEYGEPDPVENGVEYYTEDGYNVLLVR